MKITKFLIVVALLTTLSSSLVWSRDRVGPRPTPPVIVNEGSGPIAKPEECVYFTITLKNSHLLVYTSDARKFLANPVGALRADGIVVPPTAEPHWRAVAVALGRLANPRLPPSKRSLSSRPGLGILKSQVARLELPGGSIPVVGDWNGDGTITSGDFMIDPIRSLRAQRVAVPAASEPALRQLVAALKALRHAYAQRTETLNSTNSTVAKGILTIRDSQALGPASEAPGTGLNKGGKNEVIHRRPGTSNGQINHSEFQITKLSDSTTPAAPAPQPDLQIRQFVFSPGNDKTMKVHVVNTGKAVSGLCLFRLTVHKINGVSVSRVTEVKLLPLAAGKDKWLIVNAKSILPNNISLESTTFKLKADATSIVAESNETNNEVWHNL